MNDKHSGKPKQGPGRNINSSSSEHPELETQTGSGPYLFPECNNSGFSPDEARDSLLRPGSVKGKMALITALTTAVTLLAVYGAFILYELTASSDRLIEKIGSLAQVTGIHCKQRSESTRLNSSHT